MLMKEEEKENFLFLKAISMNSGQVGSLAELLSGVE